MAALPNLVQLPNLQFDVMAANVDKFGCTASVNEYPYDTARSGRDGSANELVGQRRCSCVGTRFLHITVDPASVPAVFLPRRHCLFLIVEWAEHFDLASKAHHYRSAEQIKDKLHALFVRHRVP
jgi:hypothetical protein